MPIQEHFVSVPKVIGSIANAKTIKFNCTYGEEIEKKNYQEGISHYLKVNVYVACLMKLDFSWKGPHFHSLLMLVSVNNSMR